MGNQFAGAFFYYFIIHLITEKLDCASVVDQEEHCSSCQRRWCVGMSVRFLRKGAEILRVFFTAV